jgi:hypothetical protein
MSYIESLKRDGDRYIDAQGISHENAEGALCSLLDFCGCGDPPAALRVVRDTLRLCRLGCPDPSPYAYSTWYNAFYLPAVAEVFHGDRGLEMFVRYALDSKGLTEHGGSVGSEWLTYLGEEVLMDLEAMDLDKP